MAEPVLFVRERSPAEGVVRIELGEGPRRGQDRSLILGHADVVAQSEDHTVAGAGETAVVEVWGR